MLPSLPKQNKQPEAKFGLVFRKWWNTHRILGTFEHKHTRGKNTFNLRELHEEQKIVGTMAEGDGVLLRTSSGTVGLADYIGLIKFPVYVVIRYPKDFYVIPLNRLLREKSKTLKVERAKALSITIKDD